MEAILPSDICNIVEEYERMYVYVVYRTWSADIPYKHSLFRLEQERVFSTLEKALNYVEDPEKLESCQCEEAKEDDGIFCEVHVPRYYWDERIDKHYVIVDEDDSIMRSDYMRDNYEGGGRPPEFIIQKSLVE